MKNTFVNVVLNTIYYPMNLSKLYLKNLYYELNTGFPFSRE